MAEWKDYYIAVTVEGYGDKPFKTTILGQPVVICGIGLFLNKPNGKWRASDPITGRCLQVEPNNYKGKLIQAVRKYLKEQGARSNITPLEVITRERRRYTPVIELPDYSAGE